MQELELKGIDICDTELEAKLEKFLRPVVKNNEALIVKSNVGEAVIISKKVFDKLMRVIK